MSSGLASAAVFPATAVGRIAEVRLGKMLQPKPSAAEDLEVHYLRAGSLEELTEDAALRKMWASPTESTVYSVRRGDLIIAEGGDVGRSAFVPDVPADTIIQNSLHRVRPRVGDVRFLKYALDAIHFSGWLDVLCNKATFGHLTREKLASLSIPWPSDNQQRAIADFLDTETARIDALIVKKRQLAILMIQRFRAEVDSTFGGVTELVPVRRFISRLTSGPRGWASHVADDGAAFLTIANVQRDDVELDFSKVVRIAAPDNAEARRTRVQEGDIVLSITADIGSVGIVRDGLGEAYVSQHLALLTPNRCLPDWLAFALWSPAAQRQLDSARYGGTKTQLALEDVAGVRVALPNHGEQLRLVQTLRDTRRRCLMAIEKLEKQIELLSEHRQALITAAVTGQFEVQGVAAS